MTATTAPAVASETAARARPARRHHEAWAIAGIVVVATGLRVVHLGAVGYNSDEAVYAGQGLSLAGDPAYEPFFPVFRAHPLLFQSILATTYATVGYSDLAGRLASVGFGVATVGLVVAIGRLLYTPAVGLVAGLIMAVMPYSVIVTRQVLLDGPMAFFSTLALYLLARFSASQRAAWLYAAAAAMGLAVLTKETAVLLLGGVYAFFALTASVRLRLRQVLLAGTILATVAAVYPLTVALSGASRTGGSFLVWQLLRRANHSWTFYPQVLPSALGWPVVIAAAAGLWFLRRQASWREGLLGYWILGPLLFFELWAVKGYQYLLPIAAPVAVLAARALVALASDHTSPSADPTGPAATGRHRVTPWLRRSGRHRTVGALAVAATVSLLAWQSWSAVAPDTGRSTFLAGSGGVPGGREAGTWVRQHLPEGAQVLCLGPSMANLVSFYGHRKAYGLSVSPNPLHRNPVYEAVHNPDDRIRQNNLQFLVWDSYSADRSPFFSQRLLDYAKAYHGQVLHTEYVTRGADRARVPVIVIYQVRP